MTTGEFIDQWLRNHLRPYPESVTAEEQAHFEQLLVDVCEAYRQELVHTPDNEEGITAEELAHQLYGASAQKQIDIDKACKWMKIHLPMVLDRYYPEGNNDIPDADVLNEDIRVYFRKAMEG